MKTPRPLFVLFAAAAASLSLAASVARADHGGRPPRRPPPEAFDACKGKQADAGCEVTLRDRTVAGKCAATPEGTLACRPDRPMGPPPELFAACENKKEGDACSAKLGEHTREGTCRKGHHDDKLHCRPARPPGE